MTISIISSPTKSSSGEVQFDKKDLFNDFVPPSRSSLSKQTLASLRARFAAIDHHPTPEMWAALQAVADTLEAMAEGTCSPSLYVSSLDPGVGKTTAIILFVQALLASPAHRQTAVLICLKRREQIESFVADADLCPSDFAVLTADKRLNELGCGDRNEARILLTTHSMVEKRTAGGSFANAQDFYFHGSPREVRIWDEAILPGHPISVGRDAIASLLEPLRGRHPALAAELEKLFRSLSAAKDRDRVPLPDLFRTHGITLRDALRGLREIPEALRRTIDDLSFLLGKTVTVRIDAAYGAALVGYRDTLPHDLAPILVLDASARVRTAYRLWSKHRGGTTFLPSATKSYGGLTIHLWDHPGGKGGIMNNQDEVMEAIVNTVSKRPDEPWLIVRHLDRDELEKFLRRQLPTMRDNLHFLHWGVHDATNAYANVPNVLLAGTQFLRGSQYEALTQLVVGSSEDIDPALVREVAAGEHRHLILQALCRGSVRRCENGGCPRVNAYVIGSSRYGFEAALKEVFPGARIVPWRPVLKPLKGKVGDAVVFIERKLFDEGKDEVTASAVMKAIGWTDPSNFRNRIRQHADFARTLQERGIVEIEGPAVVYQRNPCVSQDEKVAAHEWDF